jgi:hypothetical protein
LRCSANPNAIQTTVRSTGVDGDNASTVSLHRVHRLWPRNRGYEVISASVRNGFCSSPIARSIKDLSDGRIILSCQAVRESGSNHWSRFRIEPVLETHLK